MSYFRGKVGRRWTFLHFPTEKLRKDEVDMVGSIVLHLDQATHNPGVIADQATHSPDEPIVSNDDFSTNRILVRDRGDRDQPILRIFTLILQKPPEKCSIDRLAFKCAKVVTTVVAFTSQYPSMEAARKISDNIILKNLFGAGEVVAWGSVYSVKALEVMDNILTTRKLQVLDRNSGCLCNSVYWSSILALALVTQTGDIYISYIYTDKNLSWPAYVGLTYTSFTMHSLNGAIEKSVRTDNILTRFLYRNTEKCKTFRAKANFSALLKDYFTDYLKNASFQEKQLFFDMLNGEIDNDQQAKLFLFMLEKGLKRKISTLHTEHVFVRRCGKLVKLSGPLLYLANYYLDGNLVYASSQLIVDNIYFAAFLIFMSTTPNIYLDLDMSTNTLDKVFWGTAKHVNNLMKREFKQYFKKDAMLQGAGHVVTGLMSLLGLGATITIVDDTIGFQEQGVLSCAILAFTALLVADGVSVLSDKAIDYLTFLSSCEEEKKLANVCDRINSLSANIELMTADQFQNLINELQDAINYDASLIDELADHTKHKDLWEKVLSLLELDLDAPTERFL